MHKNEFYQKAKSYLNKLCNLIPNRRLGSIGNKLATNFFADTIKTWNYQIDTTEFECLDYQAKSPKLTQGEISYPIFVSPYSLACRTMKKLVVASTISELEKINCKDKILLLKGKICEEQLMPKNFVFYNPDHHKKIIKLLETKKPKAIITATSKKPQLVGALYPFPLINDGDFNIPSIYCTDVVGKQISFQKNKVFNLQIDSKRILTTASNVVATKKTDAKHKITLCAHIDTFENTPGAGDNASGVVVLLLFAEMLKNYKNQLGIEIIAINGEDHYSVAGQMDYLNRYQKSLSQIILAINIDDVGHKNGNAAYSFYDLPKKIKNKTNIIFEKFPELISGDPWYQGDHMIFVQKNIPTMAITTSNMAEVMATITHTPKDTPKTIDCKKLVEIAKALKILAINL
jgi:aminopeptidase YwaD